MSSTKPKLEEFARRHGFSSFQEMKEDLIRRKRLEDNSSSLDVGEPEEEYGEYPQTISYEDSEYLPEETGPEDAEKEDSGQELLRQVDELLDRFPDIEDADLIRREGISAVLRIKGGPETLALWRRIRHVGLSLSDAFLLVNLEDILAQQRESAWQAAVSSLAGRAHLLPSAGGALEDAPVPGSVFEFYRALNPGASEKDIRTHYHRARKKK